MTLSARHRLQHVGRDGKCRAVPLRQLSLLYAVAYVVIIGCNVIGYVIVQFKSWFHVKLKLF